MARDRGAPDPRAAIGRWLCAVAVLLVLLGAAGCGSDTTTTTGVPSAEQQLKHASVGPKRSNASKNGGEGKGAGPVNKESSSAGGYDLGRKGESTTGDTTD